MVVTVTMPSPPNCTSSRITAWPNRLQCSAVTTVVSPVTQVDEVAVNSASSSGVDCPSADAAGRESSTVPIRIATRKPRAIILVVVNKRFFLFTFRYAFRLFSILVTICGKYDFKFRLHLRKGSQQLWRKSAAVPVDHHLIRLFRLVGSLVDAL